MATDFAPTHVVPEAIPAWALPDPGQPSVAEVAAGSEVQVVQTTTGWAQVLFWNGWSGWVDERWLVPRGPRVADGPQPAPAAGWNAAPGGWTAPAPAPTPAVGASAVLTSLDVRTLIGLAGAGLVLVASFLPWLGGEFGSVDPFDLPIGVLVSDSGGGPDLGLVLLVLALAGAASLWFVRGRNAMVDAIVAGGAVVVLALWWVLRLQDSLQLSPDAPGLLSLLGIGVYVTLIGAGMLAGGTGRRAAA